MVSQSKMKIIEDLASSSTREELAWISGYLAGLLGKEAGEAVQTAPAASAAPTPLVQKLTIVYGTETGNSKKLATEFGLRAKKNSIQAKVVSLDQYRLNDLSKEEYLLAVISTQGEGEPPASAKKFYDHIHQECGRLEKLNYAVLALGDTSYPLFCKAGEDVDARLEALGGKRFAPIQKCDVDYAAEADQWFNQVLACLTSNGASAAARVSNGAAVAAPRKSGKKTYEATVLTNINLNDRGSDKETHHIEIAAEGVEYLPGDSLGLIPKNPAPLVEAVLGLLQADPAKPCSFRNETLPLRELLEGRLNIYYLPERVVGKYAALAGHDIPPMRIGLPDLLRIYPLREGQPVEELIALLEPIAPRLYSIASSPEAHSGEIHLTVARDRFLVNGEPRYGLCSDYLCGLPEDAQFEFYIHPNNQFRLPPDDRKMIMIGPGTGIAPFRSFLAHRDALGASGENWLFFGDQHFVTDFLYQTELQNWLETGVLTRLNVAFSRDQEQKVYVQHRMKQHAAELFRWLQEGAHLYICGAREPMSVDVEQTLLEIFSTQGGMSEGQAAQYLEQLAAEGRYAKDVY